MKKRFKLEIKNKSENAFPELRERERGVLAAAFFAFELFPFFPLFRLEYTASDFVAMLWGLAQ